MRVFGVVGYIACASDIYTGISVTIKKLSESICDGVLWGVYRNLTAAMYFSCSI